MSDIEYKIALNLAAIHANVLIDLLKEINSTFAPIDITPDEIAEFVKKLDDLDVYIKAMSFAHLKVKGGADNG